MTSCLKPRVMAVVEDPVQTATSAYVGGGPAATPSNSDIMTVTDSNTRAFDGSLWMPKRPCSP